MSGPDYHSGEMDADSSTRGPHRVGDAIGILNRPTGPSLITAPGVPSVDVNDFDQPDRHRAAGTVASDRHDVHKSFCQQSVRLGTSSSADLDHAATIGTHRVHRRRSLDSAD
jgi:hypothetical protein